MGFSGGERKALHHHTELVDRIQRIQLQEAAFSSPAEPGLIRLKNLRPEEARGSPVAAGSQHAGCNGAKPVRGVGLIGPALKPAGRSREVAKVPVIHERNVVVVLPFPGLSRDALLQQRDRLIRPARTSGIGLAQKDGPEPVRDGEVPDRAPS